MCDFVCQICQGEIKNSSNLMICFGCRTYFHSNCFEKVLKIFKSCAVCIKSNKMPKKIENFNQAKVVQPSKPDHVGKNVQIIMKRVQRKTKAVVKAEKMLKFKQAVREGAEIGLEVRVIPEKGRGLFTSQSLSRGDFVVEYAGDLIDINEAKMREWAYAKKTGSSFMFYFCFKEKMLCVDATEETLRMGRLVNHSRKCNVQAKPFEVDGVPRIILIANRDITAGSELTMDYGDRSIKSIKAHPWLAT